MFLYAMARLIAYFKLDMKEYKIEDYLDTLKGCCNACKLQKRCKDKDKICVLKKAVFTLGKYKLKRREKEA